MKYASTPFGRMDVAECTVAANGLMIKIHAITGWEIPEKMVASVLKQQFILKMQEGYANVNADEVEYAFRTYGTQVKDWGKSMNLSLIDEVMAPYLEARLHVSRIEEQKKPAPLQIEHKEDLSNTAMQDWLDSVSKDLKSGKLKMDLLPVMLYDWLLGKGEVKGHEPYLVPAARHKGAQLENLAMTDKNYRPAYAAYSEMFNTGCFSGSYIKELNDLAKKMVLNDFILKAK